MASTKTESPVWQMARSESAAMRVEKQIKEALLNGHFAPGDFLGSESDLVSQFGVSRLPIREALGRLQALGVVEIRTGSGGGARIANGNAAPAVEALAIQLKLMGIDPKEMFDAQQVIEVSAVGMAAQAATEEDFEQLELAIARAKELVNTQDEFTLASVAVHQAAVDAAHNHFLSSIMKAIIFILYRSIRVNTTPTVARGVVQRHEALLQALRERDAVAAQEIVTNHLQKVRARYFAR